MAVKKMHAPSMDWRGSEIKKVLFPGRQASTLDGLTLSRARDT
jgi:hypothetical protein